MVWKKQFSLKNKGCFRLKRVRMMQGFIEDRKLKLHDVIVVILTYRDST